MPTLLVSTTGGHLAQLYDVAGRLPDGDDERVWVTHDNAQSRSLLADEDVVYVPYIGMRDTRGVGRSVAVARRLHRERKLTRAVSTGSGIALGYLPYLAARGVGAHYIESAARATGPSSTGRLLRFAPGVHRYTQYERLASGPLRYVGSVFDGFTPADRPAPDLVRRVVVTIGTAEEFPFRRLLDALVPLLGAGGALERAQRHPVEVLWQTGGTPTDGLGIAPRPWLAAAELSDAMAAADVVVSHAGAGSALSALGSGRCPILVPRRPSSGEVGDDHQGQLAEELARRALAIDLAADEITVDGLLAAAARSVERVARPPMLRLVT